MPDLKNPEPFDRDEFSELRELYRADVARLEKELEARRKDCLSLARLQEIVLSSTAGIGVDAEADAHLSSCGSCRTLLASLRAARDVGSPSGAKLFTLLGSLAAFLALGFLFYWLFSEATLEPNLEDVFVSATHLRESRGQLSGPEFRTGDRVFVHATLRESAWVALLRLRPSSQLELEGDITHVTTAHWSTSFVLDDEIGDESVVVLSTALPAGVSEMESLVSQLEPLLADPGLSREERIDRLRNHVQAEGRFEVRVVSFAHTSG